VDQKGRAVVFAEKRPESVFFYLVCAILDFRYFLKHYLLHRCTQGGLCKLYSLRFCYSFSQIFIFSTNNETRDYHYQLQGKLLKVINMGRNDTDHFIRMILISESIPCLYLFKKC
jgi:hypothetical protein